MQEIAYLEVDNWPAYRVGSDGSVWSRWRKGPGSQIGKTWKLMNPRPDNDGYRRVDLYAGNGDSVTKKVCVLVCAAFHGPPKPGQVCRHDNGKCGDDRADNLLWGTTQENTDDRKRHGTIAKGDSHGKAKLTAEQIAELLALKGQIIQKEAALKFGVSRGYVGQLWSGARKRVPA